MHFDENFQCVLDRDVFGERSEEPLIPLEKWRETDSSLIFFSFEIKHLCNTGTTGNLFDYKEEIHERGVFLRGRMRERLVFLRVQTQQRTHLRPVQVHRRQ